MIDCRKSAPSFPRGLAATCCGVALALACAGSLPQQALALTAAEKQAEADAVYAQIDSLQTSLNNSMRERARAQEAYDAAVKKQAEATEAIEKETSRIGQLQEELSSYAVAMYKSGGRGRLLDVMLDSTSFNQLMTSWDSCNAIFLQGQTKLHETQKARTALETARNEYQLQGKKAEEEIAAAEAAQAQIEQTQEALRYQAEQLSAEAAELQRQEELAAEAARQAEEARQRREAEIAEAAQKAKAQEEAQTSESKQAESNEEPAETTEEDSDEGEGEGENENEGEGENENDGGSENAASDNEESSDASATSNEPAESTDTADAAAPSQIVLGPGYFTNPCPNSTNSSGFGYRTFDNSFHRGLDMAAPEGTPYFAADSGTVMYATNDGGYNGGAGNWIVIAHGSGVVTKYMHSSATFVVPGNYVERGQNIGLVGNTGDSHGAHLHFQVEVNGVAVNPLNYL